VCGGPVQRMGEPLVTFCFHSMVDSKIKKNLKMLKLFNFYLLNNLSSQKLVVFRQRWKSGSS
jgi:hypothetical protein